MARTQLVRTLKILYPSVAKSRPHSQWYGNTKTLHAGKVLYYGCSLSQEKQLEFPVHVIGTACKAANSCIPTISLRPSSSLLYIQIASLRLCYSFAQTSSVQIAKAEVIKLVPMLEVEFSLVFYQKFNIYL